MIKKKTTSSDFFSFKPKIRDPNPYPKLNINPIILIPLYFLLTSLPFTTTISTTTDPNIDQNNIERIQVFKDEDFSIPFSKVVDQIGSGRFTSKLETSSPLSKSIRVTNFEESLSIQPNKGPKIYQISLCRSRDKKLSNFWVEKRQTTLYIMYNSNFDCETVSRTLRPGAFTVIERIDFDSTGLQVVKQQILQQWNIQYHSFYHDFDQNDTFLLQVVEVNIGKSKRLVKEATLTSYRTRIHFRERVDIIPRKLNQIYYKKTDFRILKLPSNREDTQLLILYETHGSRYWVLKVVNTVLSKAKEYIYEGKNLVEIKVIKQTLLLFIFENYNPIHEIRGQYSYDVSYVVLDSRFNLDKISPVYLTTGEFLYAEFSKGTGEIKLYFSSDNTQADRFYRRIQVLTFNVNTQKLVSSKGRLSGYSTNCRVSKSQFCKEKYLRTFMVKHLGTQVLLLQTGVLNEETKVPTINSYNSTFQVSVNTDYRILGIDYPPLEVETLIGTKYGILVLNKKVDSLEQPYMYSLRYYEPRIWFNPSKFKDSDDHSFTTQYDSRNNSQDSYHRGGDPSNRNIDPLNQKSSSIIQVKITNLDQSKILKTFNFDYLDIIRNQGELDTIKHTKNSKYQHIYSSIDILKLKDIVQGNFIQVEYKSRIPGSRSLLNQQQQYQEEEEKKFNSDGVDYSDLFNSGKKRCILEEIMMHSLFRYQSQKFPNMQLSNIESPFFLDITHNSYLGYLIYKEKGNDKFSIEAINNKRRIISRGSVLKDQDIHKVVLMHEKLLIFTKSGRFYLLDPRNMDFKFLEYPGSRCLDFLVLSSQEVPEYLVCYQGRLQFEVYLYREFIQKEKNSGYVPIKMEYPRPYSVKEYSFQVRKGRIISSPDMGASFYIFLDGVFSINESLFRVDLLIKEVVTLAMTPAFREDWQSDSVYKGQKMLDLELVSDYLYGIYNIGNTYFLVCFQEGELSSDLEIREDMKISNQAFSLDVGHHKKLIYPIRLNQPFKDQSIHKIEPMFAIPIRRALSREFNMLVVMPSLPLYSRLRTFLLPKFSRSTLKLVPSCLWNGRQSSCQFSMFIQRTNTDQSLVYLYSRPQNPRLQNKLLKSKLIEIKKEKNSSSNNNSTTNSSSSSNLDNSTSENQEKVKNGDKDSSKIENKTRIEEEIAKKSKCYLDEIKGLDFSGKLTNIHLINWFGMVILEESRLDYSFNEENQIIESKMIKISFDSSYQKLGNEKITTNDTNSSSSNNIASSSPKLTFKFQVKISESSEIKYKINTGVKEDLDLNILMPEKNTSFPVSLLKGRSKSYFEGSVAIENFDFEKFEDVKDSRFQIVGSLSKIHQVRVSEYGKYEYVMSCKNFIAYNCQEYDHILITPSTLYHILNFNYFRTKDLKFKSSIVETVQLPSKICSSVLFTEGNYLKFCKKNNHLQISMIDSKTLKVTSRNLNYDISSIQDLKVIALGYGYFYVIDYRDDQVQNSITVKFKKVKGGKYSMVYVIDDKIDLEIAIPKFYPFTPEGDFKKLFILLGDTSLDSIVIILFRYSELPATQEYFKFSDSINDKNTLREFSYIRHKYDREIYQHSKLVKMAFYMKHPLEKKLISYILFEPAANTVVYLHRFGVKNKYVRFYLVNPFSNQEIDGSLQPLCYQNLCVICHKSEKVSHLVFYNVPGTYFERAIKLLEDFQYQPVYNDYDALNEKYKSLVPEPVHCFRVERFEGIIESVDIDLETVQNSYRSEKYYLFIKIGREVMYYEVSLFFEVKATGYFFHSKEMTLSFTTTNQKRLSYDYIFKNPRKLTSLEDLLYVGYTALIALGISVFIIGMLYAQEYISWREGEQHKAKRMRKIRDRMRRLKLTLAEAEAMENEISDGNSMSAESSFCAEGNLGEEEWKFEEEKRELNEEKTVGRGWTMLTSMNLLRLDDVEEEDNSEEDEFDVEDENEDEDWEEEEDQASGGISHMVTSDIYHNIEELNEQYRGATHYQKFWQSVYQQKCIMESLLLVFDDSLMIFEIDE